MQFHRRIALRLVEHDWFSVFVEFLVVFAGILAAVAVDNWRKDREEAHTIHEHLAQIANEVRTNRETIDRVQNLALVRKRTALEVVIRYLSDPSRVDEAPEKILAAFASSTWIARPWLSDNQMQALQNSGDLRLLNNPKLAGDLADNYAAGKVLFAQVDSMNNAYSAKVQEFLPASLQASTNTLRFYLRSGSTPAPVIADPMRAAEALEQIRAHKDELLPLARGEASTATATWYALERMKSDSGDLLKELAPWDTSPIVEPPVPPPSAKQSDAAKQASGNPAR